MKKVLAALSAVIASAAIVYAANIPYKVGPLDPSNQLEHFNSLIQQINSLITPQSMATYTVPRNLLDNGQMQVQQRGTATRTCGTTTIPSSAYGPDRWGCNVNVGSGAGTLIVDNTVADLPTGPIFNSAAKFYRTSGALAQPQCVMQEIASSRITPLQGQQLVLSAYIKGLANMLAESTTVNAYVFYGTGTDEGLQSFTASPAITPAFTGINSSLTAAWTISSTWTRYSYSFSLPTTATEAAVALCWTPTTGGTAGATDGFLFTGVQLEQGATPSSFEFKPIGEETAIAQRYYWQWAETASAYTASPFKCTAHTTTIAACLAPLHVTMRAAPVVTCTIGTMTRDVAGTQTAVTACGAGTTVYGISSVDEVVVTATIGSASDTDGLSGGLISGDSTGGGLITASADF